MGILDQIVAHKKKEVEECKKLVSDKELQSLSFYKRNSLNFKESIIDPGKTGIIAEFKRQSPSKGAINTTSKIDTVIKGYADGGASAVSILTDFAFFGGSIDDVMEARPLIPIPILRKEFIIDEYQIIESKAIGADAILLIACILDKKTIGSFSKIAHDLDLQVLLEVHNTEELEKINGEPDVIGVNNRNLNTFMVDIECSVNLSKIIPADCIKISESGISSVADIQYLKKNGFHGFLIGENFMKTSDPAGAFREFVHLL